MKIEPGSSRWRNPTTDSGASVLDFLISGDRRYGLRLLRHPGPASELIFQVFVIGIRRMFGRDISRDSAEGYVTSTLRKLGVGDSSDAVDLLELAFGSLRDVSAVPRSALNLVVPIAIEVVRSHAPTKGECAELVYAAERRLIRFHRQKMGSSNFLRRWLRRRRLAALSNDRAQQPEIALQLGPGSIIGKTLAALAAHDSEQVRKLPPEPSDAAAVSVTNELFLLLLHDRFSVRPDEDSLSCFADRVAAATRMPILLPEVVEQVIRVTFGGGGPIRSGPDLILQVKVAVIVQIVDELGIYCDELDSLIVQAEHTAQSY